MAPFFVLIPLAAYIPMFAYETYIAFRRIGKPLDRGGRYLHATWESTHTFLILSVNYFVWLYSAAVVEVGRAVFAALLIFGLAFIVRAILYILLFYVRKPAKDRPSLLLDRAFALTHVLLAVSIVYVVVRAAMIMIGGDYQPNVVLLPLLIPGLILLLPLISVPLYFLYRTGSR